MNSYGLTYRSTTCNSKIYASKVVAIFILIIFKKKKLHSLWNLFSLQENSCHAITPHEHMQKLLFYQLLLPQP